MKTTAIKKSNVAVTQQSGKVGNVRYIQRLGQTYVRSAYNESYTDRKSDTQMAQRMKFASLVSFGALLKDYIKGAFQTKEANQTDMNAFIHANKGQGVYRTKDQSETGYVIALPVCIARGSLGEVTTSISDGMAVSNISVGTSLPASSTIAHLSALIVANNDKWKYGDQLTIISAVQGSNGAVSVKSIRIFLSKKDSTLLSAFGTFSASGGHLAYAFSEQGCIGFIHSNTDGQVGVANMACSTEQGAFIESCLTDDFFEEARLTYGESNANYIGGNADESDSSTTGTSGSSSDTGSSTTTKYTLSLVASPASGGSVSGAGQYTAGTSVTIKANAISGYKFSQWSDGNTSATRSVTVNSNLSLTATFVEDASASTVPEGDDEGTDA